MGVDIELLAFYAEGSCTGDGVSVYPGGIESAFRPEGRCGQSASRRGISVVWS